MLIIINSYFFIFLLIIIVSLIYKFYILFLNKLVSFWVSSDGNTYKKIGQFIMDDSFHSADIKIFITNNSSKNE